MVCFINMFVTCFSLAESLALCNTPCKEIELKLYGRQKSSS